MQINRVGVALVLALCFLGLLLGCGGSPVSRLADQVDNFVDIKRAFAISADLAEIMDSAPDPSASQIYFSAIRKDGQAGIFRLPSNGGAVETVYLGAPLVRPEGISISADGKRLFVADPLIDLSKSGDIFTLSLDGSPLPKTTVGRYFKNLHGCAVKKVPQVTSRQAGGAAVDLLFFTATDLDGTPVIGSMRTDGSGDPNILFRLPKSLVISAITATQDGTKVYFLAEKLGGRTRGGVFNGYLYEGNLSQGEIAEVAPLIFSDLHGIEIFENAVSGNAGQKGEPIPDSDYQRTRSRAITSTPHRMALVSSVDPKDGTAQVLVIDLQTQQVGVVTKEIGDNPGAGGLHAALDHPRFLSWSGPTSGVYAVTLRPTAGQ